MSRWTRFLSLVLLLIGFAPSPAEPARPAAVELRARGSALGQLALVGHDEATYVDPERLASLLKGSWTAKGAQGTLTVGTRRAQFTRNHPRVVVTGASIVLGAPARLVSSGWLIPEDFLPKALGRLAPGVTSARVQVAATPASATPPAPSFPPATVTAPPRVVARPGADSVALEDLRFRTYPTYTRIVVQAASPITYTMEPGSGDVRVRLTGLHLAAPRVQGPADGLVKEVALEPSEGGAVLRLSLEGGAGPIKDFLLRDPFRVVLDVQRSKEPARTEAPKPVGTPLTTLVLDAGHGGHDPGASGPSGLNEKDVVLDVTRRVARLVEESKLGVKVVLTRSTDVFVPLRERTQFANKQRADLFISIHANAHPQSVSEGVETYFLSSEATDNEARQVAAIENGVIHLESSPASRQKGDALKSILWDLAQSEFQHESSVLAETVLDSMTRSLRLVNRGVKQAGFYVLGGAAMPAVLIEIGFMTNPKEERKLGTAEHREAIARAILAGVADYKRRHDQRMRTVDAAPAASAKR
ncbi:MAG: N-acetylmuramoyl-L-alanine amidase [Candidatus Rokuibacteriota bacterium]